jgi:hypothetical protein
MQKSLFVIVVSKIDNQFLIDDEEWKVDDMMCMYEGTYSGPGFEKAWDAGPDVWSSRSAAQRYLDDAKSSFDGVEFEIKEYRLVEE